MAAYRISRYSGYNQKEAWRSVWWTSTCWPMIVLICASPFSNAIETMIYSLLLLSIVWSLSHINANNTEKCIRRVAPLIGILVALGVFVRFTFLIFALVPCVYLLAMAIIIKSNHRVSQKQNIAIAVRHAFVYATYFLIGTFCFLFQGIFFIFID